MNKSISVVIIIAIVVFLIVLVVLWNRDGDLVVEIQTNPGVKVFAKLPDGEEQFLNSVSALAEGKIKVGVPIDADLILRYNNEEEVFPFQILKEENAITHDFNDLLNDLISVQINAIPWAEVFIKLSENGDYIPPRIQDFIIPPELNEQNTNVTPIRGGLKIPIGTTIKLVYQGKEKVFTYEEWQKESRISHDFSNP